MQSKVRTTVISTMVVLGSVWSAANAATTAPLKGRALDERGRPVAGAVVMIEPVSFSGLVEAKTDASGAFVSVPLNGAVAPFRARAYKVVNYNGQRYCVRLAPETAADAELFNPSSRPVRNFRWRMTGATGDAPDAIGSDAWGGSISFSNRINIDSNEPEYVKPDDKIELTMVPRGPLIDGSTGRTLTKVVRAKDIVANLPVGWYGVTAKLVRSDGTKESLKVSMSYYDEEPASSVDFMFKGFENCGHTGTFVRTPLYVSRTP
ncbi:carboxypeptidase-like regulatory domain-containing protein [Deinococcus yavapaiensis]|uniref:Carboxypeptidase family protein n=1 Tax=Deinococcus yavapaiensis KR-236 TaxID=694435 RepID=A0A318S8N4_9DEIO|nr:carboxypeptidase-like regulatory domain-containing protein [Deinococcus yavapaiensis]PYE52766.1 hypothetical protein DES52_11287 [Deinococcus yavapaiensis KR-236]